MMEFFVSIDFYILLVICLLIFFGVGNKSSRRSYALLIVNVFFLASLLQGGQSAVIFIIVAFFVWCGSELLFGLPESKRKMVGLAAGLAFLVLVLGISKYSFFYNSSAVVFFKNYFMSHFGFGNRVNLIGISYFIFKLIHYLYESTAGSFRKRKLISFFNYIFFFPTFTSGPIDRFDRFDGDLVNLNPRTFEFVTTGVFRVIVGLFKKIVLASLMAKHTFFLKSPSEILALNFSEILVGGYAYTFYLYFDFSGYSDMAIGVSRLFGVNTPENFNSPLRATSIQDFWGRWHMTLSGWIRDYVFTPFFKVLLKRFSTVPVYILSSISFFMAFLLCGIWHGDNFSFVLWGGLHGIALSIQIIYTWYMKTSHKKLYGVLKKSRWYIATCWLLTFNFVVFVHIIFSLNYATLKILFASIILKI